MLTKFGESEQRGVDGKGEDDRQLGRHHRSENENAIQ